VSELEYLKGAQKQKVTMRHSVGTPNGLFCTDVSLRNYSLTHPQESVTEISCLLSYTCKCNNKLACHIYYSTCSS